MSRGSPSIDFAGDFEAWGMSLREVVGKSIGATRDLFPFNQPAVGDDDEDIVAECIMLGAWMATVKARVFHVESAEVSLPLYFVYLLC